MLRGQSIFKCSISTACTRCIVENAVRARIWLTVGRHAQIAHRSPGACYLISDENTGVHVCGAMHLQRLQKQVFRYSWMLTLAAVQKDGSKCSASRDPRYCLDSVHWPIRCPMSCQCSSSRRHPYTDTVGRRIATPPCCEIAALQGELVPRAYHKIGCSRERSSRVRKQGDGEVAPSPALLAAANCFSSALLCGGGALVNAKNCVSAVGLRPWLQR